MLSFTSAGGAKPIAGRGGLEGFTPPHRFKARTAAFDGHTASTRAARSAGLNFAVIVLSKTVDVGRDHLIHRKRSPFPYEGKALTRRKVGITYPVGRDTFQSAASEALLHLARPRAGALLHERRRGEAHRRQGWVGGVYPSAQFMARTAAFDGHTAFTRAARSAGLRFAVRSLSEALDRGNTLREEERV